VNFASSVSPSGAGSLPVAVDVEIDTVFSVRGGATGELFVDNFRVWRRTRRRGAGGTIGVGVTEISTAEADGGKAISFWL
jgi:hypothetical protein